MARIRTIKPEFPQNETTGKMSRDARLLFILLWTFVDDHGRARGNSRLLAAALYPYDDDAPALIDGWLSELQALGCARRYVVDGDTYLDIPKWTKHQRIDNAGKSRIPEFVESSPQLAADRGEPPLYLVPRTVVPRTVSCAVEDRTEDHFEEFWKEKPGRGKHANPKSTALKAYRSALKAGADPGAINSAARVWASAEADKAGTEFVPMASTWLNQKRFDDYKPPPEDAEKRAAQAEFMRERGFEWRDEKWIKTG